MARRSARAAAVQMVYENMLGGDGGEETLLGLISFEPQEDDCAYINRIVKGVENEQAALDERISQHLKGWTIERMARVDLSILRTATYELLHPEPEVTASIICAEAVSLAKRFSSENSGRFVNGVLGAIARSLSGEAPVNI